MSDLLLYRSRDDNGVTVLTLGLTRSQLLDASTVLREAWLASYRAPDASRYLVHLSVDGDVSLADAPWPVPRDGVLAFTPGAAT